MHYLALSFNSPELIVWSVCIGFIIGIIATFFVKKVLGRFISLILDTDARDEDSAVSLSDLGQDSNKFLKLCLKIIGINGVVTLVCDDTESQGKKKALDLEKARFYIEGCKTEKAKAMVKGSLKWYFLPLFSILLVIIAIVVIKLLPVLTSF